MLTWLPPVLRAAGLVVVEWPGWESRTRGGGITVKGVVCHHTATGPGASDSDVARLLAAGRSNLPGPLSQLGLARDGRFWVIAAGRCNHNGYGTWGNDSVGIEAFNDGRGEPWPAVQVDAFERGCAAIIRHLGLSIAEVRGHKETDPNRKIDPTFNMDAFRVRVATHLEDTMTPEQEARILDKIGAVYNHISDRTGAVYNAVSKLPNAAQIADAVVAKLPASSGGGVSKADVKAAVIEVLRSAG